MGWDSVETRNYFQKAAYKGSLCQHMLVQLCDHCNPETKVLMEYLQKTNPLELI